MTGDEAIAECRRILGAEKPEPMRWRWRNDYSAMEREHLCRFAGVDPRTRGKYCSGEWDSIPEDVRDEIRQIARGIEVLLAAEAAGRVEIIPRDPRRRK